MIKMKLYQVDVKYIPNGMDFAESVEHRFYKAKTVSDASAICMKEIEEECYHEPFLVNEYEIISIKKVNAEVC